MMIFGDRRGTVLDRLYCIYLRCIEFVLLRDDFRYNFSDTR
jgi:hypothetical protein